MNKLNILWCKIDTSSRVAGHFDYLLDELNKVSNLTILTKKLSCPPGTYQNKVIEGQITYDPVIDNSNEFDCVIISQAFAFLEDWNKFDVPVFMLFEDQHVNARYQLKMAIDNDWIVLHRYQLKDFNNDLNGLLKKSIWFPHSVNIDIFKDYGLSKQYNLLQTGAIYPIYKIRNTVKSYFERNPYKGYRYIPRPNDFTGGRKWPVGVDYAKELNKAWFVLCCGAEVEYSVMKFFEIPSCASVIYSNYFDELGDLGFIPDKNMVVIDISNITGQIESLLQDKDNLRQIIKNGQDLIISNYTTKIQAKNMIELLREWMI